MTTMLTKLPRKSAETTAALKAAFSKPNKYKAVKVVVDGITFPSQREAKRYGILKLMEEEGSITDLELQPKFYFEFGGKKVLIRSKGFPNGRQATYRADFRYVKVSTGEVVVEEVKSAMTRKLGDYALRKAMLECMTGIVVVEV